MLDYGRRGFPEDRNTLKGGGTEKSGEETKILKMRGKAGPRCGCLKKEGGGAGPLLWTKADLPQPVYEEIYSHFFFLICSSFLGRTPSPSPPKEKKANSDWKLLWQLY